MDLFYEYPDELFCTDCRADVKPALKQRIDKYTDTDSGAELDAPCTIAVCPKCGKLLCEKDADYALLRLARQSDAAKRMLEDEMFGN